MTAFSAIREGARRVYGGRRVWVIYYSSTLLFALAAALPVSAILFADLGGSLWADRLAENFDPGWVAEFLYKAGGWPAAAYGPAALALAAGYYLLSTFLAGGAIARFASSADFWGACGRNFGRLLRLAIFAALAYGAVLMLSGVLRIIGRRLFQDSTREAPAAFFMWSCTALIGLLLVTVNMAADYARVRLVVEDHRGAFRALLGASGFVARNLRRAAGVYALALLLLAALAAAGHFAVRWMPNIALLLISQQAFVLARIWVKLLFYASETTVYQAAMPKPVEMLVYGAGEGI